MVSKENGSVLDVEGTPSCCRLPASIERPTKRKDPERSGVACTVILEASTPELCPVAYVLSSESLTESVTDKIGPNLTTVRDSPQQNLLPNQLQRSGIRETAYLHGDSFPSRARIGTGWAAIHHTHT